MIPTACLPWMRVPRKAKLDFFTRCVSGKIHIKENAHSQPPLCKMHIHTSRSTRHRTYASADMSKWYHNLRWTHPQHGSLSTSIALLTGPRSLIDGDTVPSATSSAHHHASLASHLHLLSLLSLLLPQLWKVSEPHMAQCFQRTNPHLRP